MAGDDGCEPVFARSPLLVEGDNPRVDVRGLVFHLGILVVGGVPFHPQLVAHAH
ncbi:hypothetical protein [Arthrobacter alpinus]|uniref:hypothetical protein n=1 Tax=Arthrobacter alpinus TaxID=656366 RepID=UPI0012B64914|nr:hypothetical protein [Arthrobacter alpinus]